MMILSMLLGYLIGSVPFTYLLARRGGIDLRYAGSGNVGAANVFRTMGLGEGLAAVVLDAIKGAAPVLVARQFGDSTAAAAGLSAIIGHIYPVWIGFRGGKGVATACGAFGVLAPAATGVVVALFILTVWWTRYISLGSMVASAALGPLAYFVGEPLPVVIGAVAAAVIIIERHRSNLVRLQAGTERRIGQKA